MIRTTSFPMIQSRPTLGACAGCSCAGKCAGPQPAGLGRLGCTGCSGCANAAKCTSCGPKPAGMGFALNETGVADWFSSLDWKTWALIIAVVWIIAQNVFFKPEKVVARRARRQQIKAIDRRYRQELQKAKEAE